MNYEQSMKAFQEEQERAEDYWNKAEKSLSGIRKPSEMKRIVCMMDDSAFEILEELDTEKLRFTCTYSMTPEQLVKFDAIIENAINLSLI